VAAPPSSGAGRLAGIGVQAAVAAVAVVLLMYAGRGRTFFFDEWDWVQHRAEGGPGTLLRPHNGHLMPLPVALYRIQFELVGLTYAWPVRLVTAVGHVAAAGVLFRLARARVGGTAAAVAAAVFLGLGAAWQTLLWGIQLSVTVAVLGGLVAWLALDQDRPAADVVACAALVVATASFSVGPVFAVAVAVELAAGRRRRSWWVPAVPLALFALAYVVYGESGVTSAGVRGAAWWALRAAAAAAGGLAVLGPAWGWALLGVLAVGTVVAVARGRGTPRLAGLLVAGALFWALTGASRSAGPQPDSPSASRYIEIGAPILLLLAVELCRGRRLAGWWRLPAAAAVALCVWRGVGELLTQGDGLRGNSHDVLAVAAAMELGRAYVDPDLVPMPDGAPQIRAADYLRAVDVTRSSPVGDPDARLAGLPEPSRLRGDAVLAGIELRGTPATTDASRCREMAGGETVVEVRPGAAVRIAATDEFVSLAARRFADGFPATPSLSVAPNGATRVEVLPDGGSHRWQLRVSSPAPFGVCPDS
jgi:hypothetical protein